MSQHLEIHDDPLDLEWPDHTKSESRPLTKEEWEMARRYVHPRAHLGKTLWAWWNIITLPCMAFLYESGLAFGNQDWRFHPNENPFDNFWAIVMGASWACWLFGWWMQDYGLEFYKVSGRIRLLARYHLALGNVEADHDYDDTKLVEGKFYHAVFQRSKRKGEWRVRFIGSLGWGPQEQAGANWPSRLTLLSWALVPVFLCLHTRMASFATPTQNIVGGTWQFLWYAIPNELRFQEGLTLALYPALGALLLAGSLSWIRWKWRQHKADRMVLETLGDDPLDKLWQDDRREDLRKLRPNEKRIVAKLVGPRWFFAETLMRWIALHASFLLAVWAWPFNYEAQTSGSVSRLLVVIAPLVVLMSVIGWRMLCGRLAMKVSGEYRRNNETEALIGTQIVETRRFADLLEDGRFYHVLADIHGEDGDEYSIEIAAGHGWVPQNPLHIPLLTLWSIAMSPVLWLLYSRSEDFKISTMGEEIPLVGLAPQGLRLGGYEFPFVTNLTGTLILVAHFVLLVLVSLGFFKGAWWAFLKWKARERPEEDSDLD